MSPTATNVMLRWTMIVLLLAIVPLPMVTLAQSTPGAAGADRTTPPDSCLAIRTFPVLAGEHPHDVAPAADGVRVWYTAQATGALGLLDPLTGAIETIPLGAGSSPHGVIVGPDGAAWVTDSGLNAMVRVDDASREIAVYPLDGSYANLNTAVFDPDGVLWFTGQNGIVGRLDPVTAVPGELVPVTAAPRGRGPYGIATTPKGDIYFVSLAGSYLGRIEYDDRELRITELAPPTADQGARRVWGDATGALWISEWLAGQVGRYVPATDTWTEWRLPGDAPQAYAVYVDERDDVWLSDFGANSLVRFDPDTESFASLPLPVADAAVRQIHGRPGEVWGAASGADMIVLVESTCDDG